MAEAKVIIDASRPIGPVPGILSSSIWLHHLGNDDIYTLGKFLRENRTRTVQLSLTLLQRSKSLADYKRLLNKYLDEEAPAMLLRAAKSQGFRLVIGFDPCPMPKWLSSRPGDKRPASNWGYSIETCSPPSDFKLWAKVVRLTLATLRQRGVGKLGIYIGHEQEREWIGDEKSFFRYYEYAARAAKALDKGIAVGGPGPSGWDVKRLGCSEYPEGAKEICEKEGGWSDPEGEPFIKNFIDYAATNGDGRTRVPLDFINWHHFGSSTESIKVAARTIKAWLRDAGLEGVRLYPSDWSGWHWPPYPADYIDTAEFAAFIPDALSSMWRSGIEWHGHDFNVYSPGLEKKVIAERKGSTFIGDWALFTRHGAGGGGVIKPAYNAFRLMSKMAGRDGGRKMLKTRQTAREGVNVLSATDGKRIYVLLSTYAPRGNRFAPFFAMRVSEYLRASGMEREEKWFKALVKEYRTKKKITPRGSKGQKELTRYLAGVVKCSRSRSPLSCEEKAARGLKGARSQKIREGIRGILAVEGPRDIDIEIDNLKGVTRAKVVSYTVDDYSSNSCTYNKKTEPRKTPAPCGIGGEVDKRIRHALKNARASGKRAAREELVRQFGAKEAKSLAGAAKACMNRGRTMKECLKRSASEGREKGMRAALKAYRKAWARVYYGEVDAINRLPEVALEGSKKNEKVTLKDKKALIRVRLNPNSVKLLVLQGG